MKWKNMTQMRGKGVPNMTNKHTETPASTMKRPWQREVLIVLLLASVGACVALPGAPSAADIEKGRNAPPVDLVPSMTGKVTDAVTGARVVAATVTLQGTSVLTSYTGQYGIQPLPPPGTYPVTITHPQYLDLHQDVEITKPFQLMDFQLRPR